jgi:hypothetical protein
MGFTACDKKETENNNFAQAIAGTYNGKLLINDSDGGNAQIVITRVDDQHATLKMDESIEGIAVKIECRTEVTYSGNLYRVAGNTTFNMGTVDLPVAVNGTVDKSGKTSILIEVNDVPLMGRILVTFEGQK